VDKEVGALKYEITPLNFDGTLTATSYLDGDIKNEDANYDEKFWDPVNTWTKDSRMSVTLKTKKLDFHFCSTIETQIISNGTKLELTGTAKKATKYASLVYDLPLTEGKSIAIYKYAANVTNRD